MRKQRYIAGEWVDSSGGIWRACTPSTGEVLAEIGLGTGEDVDRAATAEAVEACARSGVGASLNLYVGGKQDQLHGEPVILSGLMKSLHDGKYVESKPRHGGQRFRDQGVTAVLEIQNSTPLLSSLLVLTPHREPSFSLHQLLSLGIQPPRQKILVVKAAIAFRAAYEPIAGRIIEVDPPGRTAVNPARFIYRRMRAHSIAWVRIHNPSGSRRVVSGAIKEVTYRINLTRTLQPSLNYYGRSVSTLSTYL